MKTYTKTITLDAKQMSALLNSVQDKIVNLNERLHKSDSESFIDFAKEQLEALEGAYAELMKPDEKIDLNENQPALYLKEQPTEVRKWCRKCDVTGVGTDEGFVHYDGDFITITEEDTAKVLREDIRNGVYDTLEEYLPEQFDSWTDNEVIEWCFENTSLYFNEWNLEEEIKFGGYYFIEYSDGSIKQA